MIRTAICEDEANTRALIAALIRAQPYACEIVAYASAEECLADSKTPDLLFLDIGLQASGAGGTGGACGMGETAGACSDGSTGKTGTGDKGEACGTGGTGSTGGKGSAGDHGMDGMALARALRKQTPSARPVRMPVIVFVTGYEQYVFDAFDVGAFHYLLKPVDEKKFAAVFARAAEEILSAGQSAPVPRALTLHIGNSSRTVPLSDIHYIESSGHKAVLHLEDGTLACYAKLGDLERELQGSFFRIHKGYLVNLSYITGYSRSEVTLSGGGTLLLSKYKYRDFVKAYLHFLKQGAGL